MTFSIPVDDRVRACTFDAMDELCRLCGVADPEELLRRPHLDQLHDALALIRAGLLTIREMYDEEGMRSMLVQVGKGTTPKISR